MRTAPPKKHTKNNQELVRTLIIEAEFIVKKKTLEIAQEDEKDTARPSKLAEAVDEMKRTKTNNNTHKCE